MASDERRAIIQQTTMYRAYCPSCGLLGGAWESPWFLSEYDARQVKRYHDEENHE